MSAILLSLPLMSTGCSAEKVEVDPAATYAADSLANELILRYKALDISSKTSTRGPRKNLSEAAIAARDQADAKTKNRITKKRAAATTIDDVVDDIQSKILLIKATPPPVTVEKMSETIKNDNSLPESDKKSLTDLIARLGK